MKYVFLKVTWFLVVRLCRCSYFLFRWLFYHSMRLCPKSSFIGWNNAKRMQKEQMNRIELDCYWITRRWFQKSFLCSTAKIHFLAWEEDRHRKQLKKSFHLTHIYLYYWNIFKLWHMVCKDQWFSTFLRPRHLLTHNFCSQHKFFLHI